MDWLEPALTAAKLKTLSIYCISAIPGCQIDPYLPYFEDLAAQGCKIDIHSSHGFCPAKVSRFQQAGFTVQGYTAKLRQKGDNLNAEIKGPPYFERSLQLVRDASEDQTIFDRYTRQSVNFDCWFNLHSCDWYIRKSTGRSCDSLHLHKPSLRISVL